MYVLHRIVFYAVLNVVTAVGLPWPMPVLLLLVLLVRYPRIPPGSYDVVTNSSDPTVAPRLQAFRCMLLERGIPCAPVTNPTARQAPTGPGSCYSQ